MSSQAIQFSVSSIKDGEAQPADIAQFLFSKSLRLSATPHFCTRFAFGLPDALVFTPLDDFALPGASAFDFSTLAGAGLNPRRRNRSSSSPTRSAASSGLNQ